MALKIKKNIRPRFSNYRIWCSLQGSWCGWKLVFYNLLIFVFFYLKFVFWCMMQTIWITVVSSSTDHSLCSNKHLFTSFQIVFIPHIVRLLTRVHVALIYRAVKFSFLILKHTCHMLVDLTFRRSDYHSCILFRRFGVQNLGPKTD